MRDDLVLVPLVVGDDAAEEEVGATDGSRLGRRSAASPVHLASSEQPDGVDVEDRRRGPW